MSNLSGYDSEAIGFESISRQKTDAESSETQTTEFSESGVGCQTTLSKDFGCSTTPDDFSDKKLSYSPGLNEFLNRVVPAMMDQLEQNEQELASSSSDSDDEECIPAKLFQELKVKDVSSGAGDQETPSVLAITWSSSGNSFAVAVGYPRHEDWCNHDGLVRIYTIKRAEGDKFVHNLDISEKNCITTVKYHPTVAALLAYGTFCGEIVLCNLQDPSTEMQLASPTDSHGSMRISALHWANPNLANAYLTLQIINKGKRRNAADQILASSGSDGSINIWQVNANQRTFENVTTYLINALKKTPAPDITCFDFIKTFPLRPSEDKISDDFFVVGTVTGQLFLCKTKGRQILNSSAVDPVKEVLDGHSTCILDVAFSYQKPGTFASISIDSELRIYDVNQSAPLKVLCLDVPITSMSWLPTNPCIVVVGLKSDNEELLRVYNVVSGRRVAVDGLNGKGVITTVAVNQSGSCRILAGDSASRVYIWDLPSRRIKLTSEDLMF